VTNLPAGISIPENFSTNPGKTGNLQAVLKLKVGCPIVVTSNHPKQKFREDGIMNGARGYVQAIQTSKTNPEKVEIVWVVFHNENIGKRYRFEHNHLRKGFNPGHKNATPILPSRKSFQTNFGNIEYQRANFALSLAYAVTAHKSQGATLTEVLLDFGPDEDLKIKNYIIAGSFYVALTRVTEGKFLFMRSFNPSYIVVNNAIKCKIDALIQQKQYEFKNTFLNQKVFVNDSNELKAGYLNINGFKEANHCHYLNEDKNLQDLDLIVIAETKLKETEKINNWKILGRYDANDDKKHCGFLMLKSNKSNLNSKLIISHSAAKREGKLQIEALIVKLGNGITIGFVYCRTTPTNAEIDALKKLFSGCDILMGDLNISQRISS